MGYQNKLLVSSGVSSGRQDEDISLATPTHHGQVTVEPFSAEERPEDNETKARMKESPKFHLLPSSLDDPRVYIHEWCAYRCVVCDCKSKAKEERQCGEVERKEWGAVVAKLES